MNLYFRLFLILIGEWFQKRAVPDRVESALSVLHFRCWFMDADVNRHLNNARYLSFMDLGRLSLVHTVGLAPLVSKYKWMPMVDGVEIQFFKGVRPFQKVRLETRILGWTERHFFLEQRFLLPDGSLSALAEVRTLFARKGGVTPSAELLEKLGVDQTSPPLAERLLAWNAHLEDKRLAERERETVN